MNCEYLDHQRRSIDILKGLKVSEMRRIDCTNQATHVVIGLDEIGGVRQGRHLLVCQPHSTQYGSVQRYGGPRSSIPWAARQPLRPVCIVRRIEEDA